MTIDIFVSVGNLLIETPRAFNNKMPNSLSFDILGSKRESVFSVFKLQSLKVQRADLTCDVTSIRLQWFDPWPISNEYSNFAGACTGHVTFFLYKITTLCSPVCKAFNAYGAVWDSLLHIQFFSHSSKNTYFLLKMKWKLKS